ncbi:MAG: PAS domain S-box protein [Proteobacteria bacterium]|nr:PAS domain S-box protein [Pseudomonadota bacterium]MBU1715802.1 PAS domain S-box protein [Pseudomonadota bacterium]
MYNKKNKYIFFVSSSFVLVYLLANFFVIVPSFSKILIWDVEKEAGAITALLSSMISAGLTDGLSEKEQYDLELLDNVRRDFGLIKIKIFEKSGKVVYSSDRKDIGQINENDYFRTVVAKGGKYSKFNFIGDKTLEGQETKVDLLETYVPVFINREFAGAVEIYFDITEQQRRLNNAVFLSTLLPFLLLFVLLAVVFFWENRGNNGLGNAEVLVCQHSPLFYFSLIAGSIYIAEIFVMIFLSVWKPSSVLLGAFFDSSVLVMTIVPFLYFFMLRPLIAQIAVSSEAESLLRNAQVSLEKRVEERTDELHEKNTLLAAEIHEREITAQELKKSNKVHLLLNSLLKCALENPPMAELLDFFVQQVTAIPELALQDRGAIFIMEGSPATLVLKAHRNLAAPLVEICHHVPLGRCLCGRVAVSGEVLFVDQIDDRHDNSFAGIRPHGHYCVPIIAPDRQVSGVFTVYVDAGAKHNEQVEKFLQAMASVLGVVIQNRSSEQRRLESDEKYRAITETAQDAIILMGDRGEVIFWNPAATRMFGYPQSEALGKDLYQLIAPERYLRQYKGKVEKFLQTGQGKSVGTMLEVSGLRKDGSEFPLELSLSSVRINNKVAAVGLVRDISERVNSENERNVLQVQLRQAQKMEAIGTLAGGIAHDFNNILTAILGYADLLQDSVAGNQEAMMDLGQVIQAGERAKNLVRQILTFSRQTEKELMPVQVSLIVKEALKLLRASIPSTIEIRQNIEIGEATVLTDPTQVHQIIMNMCANSFHAMPDGGLLEITLDDQQPAPDLLHGYPEMKAGPFLCLKIRDTGHGMSPEIRHRIFEPYFSTKKKEDGTGLGLSVVHGIVSQMGGAIRVESIIGQGTTFFLYLPLAVEGEEVEEPVSEGTFLGTESILFVDDELPLTELGKRNLESLGYKVATRTSSVEALAAFRHHPARYDLVITDQAMPNMNGITLAVEMLKIRADLPVILCTGFNERDIHLKMGAVGIREVLLKPVSKNQLGAAVRRVLDENNLRK